MVYFGSLVRFGPVVDFFEREEYFLFACGLVYQGAFLNILVYELVTPPCCPTVLRHHVAVVVSAEVEVF